MKDRSKIYTYTVIYSAAEAFQSQTPYVVAIIEEDGEKFAAMVDGYAEGKVIGVGTEVEFLRQDDKGNPIYQFIN